MVLHSHELIEIIKKRTHDYYLKMKGEKNE
jgi:hypothetical protein